MPEASVIFLLAGCLINRDLYEDMKSRPAEEAAEQVDADEDGSIAADDCDDSDAGVFPGASASVDARRTNARLGEAVAGSADRSVWAIGAPTWNTDRSGAVVLFPVD